MESNILDYSVYVSCQRKCKRYGACFASNWLGFNPQHHIWSPKYKYYQEWSLITKPELTTEKCRFCLQTKVQIMLLKITLYFILLSFIYITPYHPLENSRLVAPFHTWRKPIRAILEQYTLTLYILHLIIITIFWLLIISETN